MEHTLTLTTNELTALKDLLIEEKMRMDDDGREGAFDASILRRIYNKARAVK
jgi:predicted hotdog family 3-hydroxylacyl-ACP dehydratase